MSLIAILEAKEIFFDSWNNIIGEMLKKKKLFSLLPLWEGVDCCFMNVLLALSSWFFLLCVDIVNLH